MCSPHLSELVLLLLGVDKTSSYTQTTGLVTGLYTPFPSPVVMFGMNCVTFKNHLKVLAHVNKVLCPSFSRQGSNLVTF